MSNACNAHTNKREASMVFWWRMQHPNNSFCDGTGSVKASYFAWGNLYYHLHDCVLSMASYFFFFFLFLLPFKFTLTFQNFPLIYWYFNFSYFFIFIIFALGSFIKFLFVFNFIIKFIIVICYFLKNMILILFVLIFFLGSCCEFNFFI